MAYIRLKDYLESLSTKGSSSDGDLLPILDSDASNALKSVTKGTLVSLENIAGFTAFSQSIENQLANTSQFSESLDDTFAKDTEVATTASLINSSITSVSTNLSNYETENNGVVQAIQAYTSSLKGAITVSGDDVSIKGTLTTNNFFAQYVTSSILITTGSNKFGDNVVDKHEFTGSVHFDDTIYLDGEPIGISALNAFSSSVNNSIVQIGNHTSSVDNSVTLFGAHTASQTTINSGISAVTGAFATELGEIQTQLTNRRGELNGLEAYTASLKSVGLISSSAQIAVEISGSGFTSASGEFEELTLTRGDGTTAKVDLSPRKVLELVKNKESQTLPKGTPVYVSGSTGNAAHIYAASASRADRMPAAFVLNQELAFDAEGYGIVVGYINGVDTSAFNEGDNVYVGASGGYTNVKPTGNSNRIQKLGNVIAVDAVNGSGVISGAGRSNDVPNIQEGYMWVGGPNDVSYQLSTSSLSAGSYTDSDNLSYLNSLLVVSKSAGGDLDVNGAITASNANFTGTLSYGGIDSDLENSGNIKRQILFYQPVSKRLLRNGGGHLQFQPGANLLWATNVTSSNVEVSGDITGSNISINDILTLTPRTTTPTSPQSGSFIVSGSGATIKPFFYDGNQWQEISFV